MNADPELCYLTAVQARDRFVERSLSPVELVTSLVARIEDVEPKVNAFTHTFFDRALDEARKAEKRYARGGAHPRPLEGIPIVIKDFHDVKGETTTYGSRLHEHHRPGRSLVYVDRLLHAGAILLGRTTTPEFALLGVTHSDLWGVTRNPWNLELSPGGSSGGAGAALAAGMTTLADGSDIGGSIRIPASCCGVFGLKPSHGRVPSGGPGSLDSYLAYGPMTRTVADAVLMLNVMAGQHRDDPASVPDQLDLPLQPDGIKGWRIALSMDLGYFEVDPEVVRNTESAAAALREAGAIVQEVRRVTKIEFPGGVGLCIEASSTVTGTVNCTRDQVGNFNSISPKHSLDPPCVRGRRSPLRGVPGLSGPREDVARGPGTPLRSGPRVPGVHARHAETRARGGRRHPPLDVPGHGQRLRAVPRAASHVRDRVRLGLLPCPALAHQGRLRVGGRGADVARDARS